MRLFTARFRLGLFDPAGASPWSSLGEETIDSPANRQLALEAAARGVVLLENRNATLPLGPAVRQIAVVGPTADDPEVLLANYHGTPSHAVTLLEGIRAAARARGASVRYARGAPLAGGGRSSAQLREAVAAARKSDVVVAVAGPRPAARRRGGRDRAQPRRRSARPGPARVAGEAARGAGRDRQAGRPRADRRRRARRAVRRRARPAALLDAWYPGEEGGTALADVLFGDVNPAGRLPVTFYRSVADLPPFADYAMQRANLPLLDRGRRSTGSATASRTRRSATRTSPSPPTARTSSPSTSRTPARAPATRSSRSTSRRTIRRPTRRAAGSALSRGSRWRRGSGAPSRSPFRPRRSLSSTSAACAGRSGGRSMSRWAVSSRAPRVAIRADPEALSNQFAFSGFSGPSGGLRRARSTDLVSVIQGDSCHAVSA